MSPEKRYTALKAGLLFSLSLFALNTVHGFMPQYGSVGFIVPSQVMNGSSFGYNTTLNGFVGNFTVGEWITNSTLAIKLCYNPVPFNFKPGIPVLASCQPVMPSAFNNQIVQAVLTMNSTDVQGSSRQWLGPTILVNSTSNTGGGGGCLSRSCRTNS